MRWKREIRGVRDFRKASLVEEAGGSWRKLEEAEEAEEKE
jgi:hypothetical protein